MKTYLLLRNNRQSGPFTLTEMLTEGLRPHDLVWVEGQSASWRYPSELEELKAHVPPAVPEDEVELGFSEVQNRVAPHRPGYSPALRGIPDIPIGRIVLGAELRKATLAPAVLNPLPSGPVFNEQSIPAFDALAGLLPDEDLMPTMAWQAHTDAQPDADLSDGPDPMVAQLPSGRTASLSSAGDQRKIRVVLPAALADKTTVVIRRRDMSGQAMPETRGRVRRPVLEFIPDEHSGAEVPTGDSGIALALAASPQPAEPLLPATSVVAVSEQSVESPADLDSRISDTVSSAVPGVETSMIDAELVRITEVAPAFGQLVAEATNDLPYAKEPRTLRVNIGLVQKIAVITAIVSLVTVALLIANAIFNPNAYQYGTKPAVKPVEKVSTSATPGSVRP
jgi:hypothetical protein